MTVPAPDGIGRREQRDDREQTRRRIVPSARTVAATILGVTLVIVGFLLYASTVRPPSASVVRGDAVLYVQDPGVSARLKVMARPDRTSSPGSSISIDLVFDSWRQVPGVAWALVLSDDACFVERGHCIDRVDSTMTTGLPQGANVTRVAIGRPPFRANPKDYTAQVVYGTTKMDKSNGHRGQANITGQIKGTIVAASGPTWNLRLPSYGRLASSSLLDFARQPGALDISIPGTWRRPETFQVEVAVDAPANDSNHRVDTASPPLADPTVLRWEGGEAVRAIVQRTDLQLEAREQRNVFVLGAVVGAGTALVLALFEFVLAVLLGFTASRASRSWRAARGRREQAPAGSRRGTSPTPRPGP